MVGSVAPFCTLAPHKTRNSTRNPIQFPLLPASSDERGRIGSAAMGFRRPVPTSIVSASPSSRQEMIGRGGGQDVGVGGANGDSRPPPFSYVWTVTAWNWTYVSVVGEYNLFYAPSLVRVAAELVRLPLFFCFMRTLLLPRRSECVCS
jgi:hypothetical protein